MLKKHFSGLSNDGEFDNNSISKRIFKDIGSFKVCYCLKHMTLLYIGLENTGHHGAIVYHVGNYQKQACFYHTYITINLLFTAFQLSCSMFIYNI